jgi:hypothetical protein
MLLFTYGYNFISDVNVCDVTITTGQHVNRFSVNNEQMHVTG